MIPYRAIFLVLCGGALLAACGAEGLAVGGRLTDEVGAPFAAGAYVLDAAFVTNETAAPLAAVRVEVKTDAAGNYVTTLPVPVEALGSAGPALWLCQSFSRPDGTSVAALPAQRLGYAPYALQAASADRLAATNGAHGVESLSVRAALRADTLVATNRLVSGGVFVTADVSADRAAAVRIDSLQVGSSGSALFGRVAGATVDGARGGELRLDGVVAAGEGLFELTLVTDDALGLSAELSRTPQGGVAETVCALASPETTGATRRVLTVPVRTGDCLGVTASCGETGRVSAAYGFIYFGKSNGGSAPEGENE